MPTLGEVLPRFLQDMGIDTVFGIPGVHTVELYRGLPGTRLRHITPRHEQGAGFMADGYARVTGRPAACFIISGPGVTNITTAMGQAYADSIPMLVISSALNRNEIGRGEGRLHELKDQSATAEGVAAWSHTVMSPADLPAVLNRAMATFNGARPRPVHIELPLDVIVAEADDLVLTPSVPCRPAPDATAIAQAADMLRGAQRPRCGGWPKPWARPSCPLSTPRVLCPRITRCWLAACCRSPLWWTSLPQPMSCWPLVPSWARRIRCVSEAIRKLAAR